MINIIKVLIGLATIVATTATTVVALDSRYVHRDEYVEFKIKVGVLIAESNSNTRKMFVEYRLSELDKKELEGNITPSESVEYRHLTRTKDNVPLFDGSVVTKDFLKVVPNNTMIMPQSKH